MKDNLNSSHSGDNRGHPPGHYMPGLDGLRALSVIAVIAYHLDLKWAPGGLLGVGIFFVLSGYLITDQIILQWKRNNKKFNLKDFWLRRARRLLPAMFAMLAFVALWLILFDSSRLAALQGDFASAALYFNNWWFIFHNVSYFESFGPPSPIGHLWSLAIEEQFYFIWPIVLMIMLHIVPQRGKIFLLTLTGAAVSALAMALIYDPGYRSESSILRHGYESFCSVDRSCTCHRVAESIYNRKSLPQSSKYPRSDRRSRFIHHHLHDMAYE